MPDDNNGEALKITGLNHSFGTGEIRNQILFGIDLTIEPGELVIMTGPSGCGKTTLLTLIGSLRHIQEGSLRVLGWELAGLSDAELVEVRRNIGFIFQTHNLFESLTALQNVRMALELKDSNSARNRQRAEEVLIQVGLKERIGYKRKGLSGGQRQRVAIALRPGQQAQADPGRRADGGPRRPVDRDRFETDETARQAGEDHDPRCHPRRQDLEPCRPYQHHGRGSDQVQHPHDRDHPGLHVPQQVPGVLLNSRDRALMSSYTERGWVNLLHQRLT